MSQQPTYRYTTDPEEIAAELEEIAGRILDIRPVAFAAPVRLFIDFQVNTYDEALGRRTVDQVASMTSADTSTDADAMYRTRSSQGLWTLNCSVFVEQQTEIERLKAEVDRLRVELAEQAAQAVADVDQDDEDDCICLDVDGFHTCGAYTSENHRALWRLATAAERKQLLVQAHAEAVRLDDEHCRRCRRYSCTCVTTGRSPEVTSEWVAATPAGERNLIERAHAEAIEAADLRRRLITAGTLHTTGGAR